LIFKFLVFDSCFNFWSSILASRPNPDSLVSWHITVILTPHALHLRPTFCVRVRLAPLLPSVRFACIRYSASLLQPTPTLPLVLKVAHHRHPLYPPPRCLGTSSDLHTNATTCPFRCAYRRAYRIYRAQHFGWYTRAKRTDGSIHPLVLRETSLWHQLESRRVRYSRRRPRYTRHRVLSGCA
jgi:hypothetical protein